MINKTIILIIFGLFTINCAKNDEQIFNSTEYIEVYDNSENLLEKNRSIYYGQFLLTGKVIKKIGEQIVSIKEYKDGKLHGIEITYYLNGNVKEERYYENGFKTGEHRGWWESGNIKYIYHFKNDVFNGNIKVWNETGMLFNDLNYVNGYEDGLQKAWMINGEIQANYFVKGNRKYGITGVKDCKTEIPQISRK